MRVAWLLGLGLAAGCVSERAGYAVAESAAPDRPTLRQAVEAYGNPAALRATKNAAPVSGAAFPRPARLALKRPGGCGGA